MKKLFILLILFLLSGLKNSHANVQHNVNFDEKNIITSNDSIYTKIKIIGCGPLSDTEIGYPNLPVKIVKLIIPQGNEISNINITNIIKKNIEGSFLVIPKQYPIKNSEQNETHFFIQPDSNIYTSDTPYPQEIVKVLRYGDFSGVNRIVTLAVYPMQYFPKSGKLVFHESITLDLTTTSGKESRIRPKSIDPVSYLIDKNALKARVDNPEDVDIYGWFPPVVQGSMKTSPAKIATTPAFYNYVVITTSTLSPYFDNFVKWIGRKGLSAGVVNVNDIYSNYSGDGQGLNDNAGKMRGYLKAGQNIGPNSIKWALIAGVDSLVPVRYGWGFANSDDPDDIIPTDYYYSDLNGKWECDGDNRYGEAYQDSIEWEPEINVGRLPCINGTDVTNWIEKTLKYEQNPGNGSVSNYLDKTLWVAADEMQDYPEYSMSQYWIDYLAPEFANFTTILETVSGTPDGNAPNPDAPTAQDVTQSNNGRFGFVNWFCHGNPNSIAIRTAYYNQTPKTYLYSFSAGMSYDGLNDINNENYYSINTSTSCYICAFDNYLQGSYPGRSMAEIWTTYPKKCGPEIMGNTRYGYIQCEVNENFIIICWVRIMIKT